MKSIILFLLLSTLAMFSQDMTGGSFVVLNGTPTYELVARSKARNNNQFVVGRTYEVNRDAYYFGTNADVAAYFSHGMIGKIFKGSEFSINSFYQEIINATNEPAKLKVGSHAFSATLMKGNGYFNFDGGSEISSCVISTPLVDVELQKGKFYFNVEDGGVMVFVLEGKAIAHGERNKKEECEAGKAIVAAPIRFQMKGVDDKVFLNVKKANTVELLQQANILQKAPADFIFVVINKKVVAVRIF